MINAPRSKARESLSSEINSQCAKYYHQAQKMRTYLTFLGAWRLFAIKTSHGHLVGFPSRGIPTTVRKLRPI
jgi:hypothetical protein